jgi:hypothetical protein
VSPRPRGSRILRPARGGFRPPSRA